MDRKKFSWKERGNSFTYALEGLKQVLRTEHNSWIHLGATVAVTILGFIFKISATEFLAIVIVMAMVWMAEIFNTAIEKAMDHISREHHPGIKLVKDLAAAAVLVAAIAAFIVGCIIFVPKIVGMN